MDIADVSGLSHYFFNTTLGVYPHGLVRHLVRLRSVDVVYKLLFASITKQCGRPRFPNNLEL